MKLDSGKAESRRRIHRSRLEHKVRQRDDIIRPMSVYVRGYRPKPKDDAAEQTMPPPMHEVYYSGKPELIFDEHRYATMHSDILNDMRVYVGHHFCQFEVAKLDDGKFAIICKSHPGLTAEDEITRYGKLLADVAGSTFEGTNKYGGHQPQYRWEFWTITEPIQHVATVELTPNDVIGMNGQSDDQKLEYLRTKFAYLFKRFD
jgi:hypothetical protein